MPHTAGPHAGTLREDLIRNLRLDFFDEEEIGALLADIDALDERIRRKAFALCHALSQASSSLLPNTVKRLKAAQEFLGQRDLDRWMSEAYNIFDHHGVGALIDFISRIDEETLARFQTRGGLPLPEVLAVLEAFLRGLSGSELKIAPAEDAYTDTSTVFLPATMAAYEDRGRNYLIYKFLVAHAWAQIVSGTLSPDGGLLGDFIVDADDGCHDIGSFFRAFADPGLTADIYQVLEAIRLDTFLRTALPGLMREMDPVRQDLLAGRPPMSGLPEKTAFVESLYRSYLRRAYPRQRPPEGSGNEDPLLPEDAAEALEALGQEGSVRESLTLLLRFHDIASRLNGQYERPDLGPLLGTLRPGEVSLALKAAKRTRQQRADGIISKLLEMPDFEPQKRTSHPGGRREQKADPGKEYLLIKGRVIELDSEMREVLDERGGIPGGIIVKGADMGGSASPVRISDMLEEESPEEQIVRDGGIFYDEWDYRRGGYKKHWCILREKNIHPGHEPFVELTVSRYHGYIRVLRKKFELLRREPKMMRRQREGEDIDLDAVIDAYSDIRAGLPPAEDLMTRYDRQERNIAVLFLLDMSGSTKGWVNLAEKEALVMMAEALEALGDRYAIFGFSGMKRTNCEFYRIKGFDESYGEEVKKRISGIEPKDYTRMGPAIRHSTKILMTVEARTRLFITLSDGRPEDYDAYKGDYAIEDTRRALAEAKEQGIHSFCITIDRDAGRYLGHMYGEVNYTVIDDVKKLPSRITEIYRRLTT